MTPDPDPPDSELNPTELKYVGPATAAVLADAPFGAEAIRDRSVSFRQLLNVGVNPGVAGRIRREHSLPWAFDAEALDELDRRSTQIRGLQDGERAWVAASAGEWTETEPEPTADDSPEAAEQAWLEGEAEPAEADGSGDAVAAEAAWRDRAKPEPVTAVDGVGEVTEEQLAEAGITSARALAAADPEEVAEALDLSTTRLHRLRDNAADLVG